MFPFTSRNTLLPLPCFDHFFDDVFDVEPFSVPRRHVETPKLLIRNGAKSSMLELELPRFQPKDVEVKVNDKEGLITIRAKRQGDSAAMDDVFFGENTNFTQFERAFSVDKKFYDLSKVTHKLEHGVLAVQIPRIVQSKAIEQPKVEKLPVSEAPKTEDKGAKTDAASEKKDTQEKNEDGVVTTTQRSGSDDISTQKFVKAWPPRIQSNETDTMLEYTCTMPETIKPESIHMNLEDGAINFRVSHQAQVTEKDAKGNVVFSSNRSVGYSTPLLVPKGTALKDVTTSYKDGVLQISVKKSSSETVGKLHVNVAK